MKKILLTISAALLSASSFAQTGDPDWVAKGYAMPYSEWTGFACEYFIGQSYTVKGWDEEKTIQIIDNYGTVQTITNDDEEYITKMNGKEIEYTEVTASTGTYKQSYDYVSNYFSFGTYYYANFYPGYYSYALCDESEGYALLSAYYYDMRMPVDAQWGYIYITWNKTATKDVKEISWSTVATPRWGLEAYSRSDSETARATGHITASIDEKPVLVAYTDDSFTAFAYAGVHGYDLNFSLTADSTIIVTDCDDHNAKETLHRVATGLQEYDRLGIYNNGSATDYNELLINPSHGYLYFPYAVGYTPEKPASGKYPYICYGLAWYNPDYVCNNANIVAQEWSDAAGGYVDLPADSVLFGGVKTRDLQYYKSEDLYIIPEYRGEGSADLYFKMNADSTVQVVDLPFGAFVEMSGYSYDWGYNGKVYGTSGGDPINAWTYFETSISDGYYYSYVDVTLCKDENGYNAFDGQGGQVYFFAGTGVGSNSPTGYYCYSLGWGDLDPATETGIAPIKPAQPATTFQGYYDLQGRQISAPRRGLYIKNGKKLLVK